MDYSSNLSFSCGSGDLKLYSVKDCAPGIEAYVATSPFTRSICNNPRVFGLEYTNNLRKACAETFKCFPALFSEREAVVFNILRGGLNFGLREALGEAFGWNAHTTCFISAQRARDDSDPENWHITENSYKKVYFPPVASFIFGDVVATGTSLRYGLKELIANAIEQKVDLRNIFFFTYGGGKAGEILSEITAECRKAFPNFGKTILIYLEGRFTCPTLETPLTIRLTGTDLVRYGALMAPEFVDSQYEDPKYPIERCIIYDAGSRAFWCREYILDVIGYWKEVLSMAERGVSFESLLNERFPGLDVSRFPSPDLKKLAVDQITYMEQQL